jgi:hypothetical protein
VLVELEWIGGRPDLEGGRHKAKEQAGVKNSVSLKTEGDSSTAQADAFTGVKHRKADPSPPFANNATGFGPAKASGMQARR